MQTELLGVNGCNLCVGQQFVAKRPLVVACLGKNSIQSTSGPPCPFMPLYFSHVVPNNRWDETMDTQNVKFSVACNKGISNQRSEKVVQEKRVVFTSLKLR